MEVVSWGRAGRVRASPAGGDEDRAKKCSGIYRGEKDFRRHRPEEDHERDNDTIRSG